MKNKNMIIIVSGIILILFAVWFMTSSDALGLGYRISGILFGIGSGALGAGIANIYSNNIYKKNPQLAKKMKIEQNDERNIVIKNKAQAKAGTIIVYLIYILAMVMSALGCKLWMILSLLSVNLVYGLCVVFFTNKFNKQG